MYDIGALLSRLDERHRHALEWFYKRAGTEESWPEPLPDGTLLATKAKGIYKPEWTGYALSVRQTLTGTYADRDPIIRSDGTWVYPYFQENTNPSARDDEYTNRSLMDCLRDSIPVGVMRQTHGKPGVRYKILGIALVAGWDGGYFFLEGFSPHGISRGRGGAGEADALVDQLQATAFDPASTFDGRRKIMATIVQRQGQATFRNTLLTAYGKQCAVTSCSVQEVLEAAHIVPYRGPLTNHPTNGLLLRADLHTLFDRGLLFVDSDSMTIRVARRLSGATYGELHGMPLRIPQDPAFQPSIEALDMHRRWVETGLAEIDHR